MRVLSLLCLMLAGCAPGILNYNPLPDESGQRGYSIQSFYDDWQPVNLARESLDQKARQLCGGNYKRLREQAHERRTAWGTHNGQYDLIWEVRCTS